MNPLIEIFHELRLYLKIPVIQAAQSGDRPGYPYCTWNILSGEIESNHQWVREQKTIQNDNIEVTHHIDKSVVVSINLFHVGEGDCEGEIYQLAEKALLWFSLEGKALSLSYQLLPKVLSPKITSRKTLLESVNYEHRVGFDLEFSGHIRSTHNVEQIKEIDYKVKRRI